MMAVAEVMGEAQEVATVVVMEATMDMVEDIMAEGITAVDTMAVGAITILGYTGDQAHIGMGDGPIIIRQLMITIPRQIIIILHPNQIIIIPHRVNRRRVMLAKLRRGGTNLSFIPAKARVRKNRPKTAMIARLGQQAKQGLTQPSPHPRDYPRLS